MATSKIGDRVFAVLNANPEEVYLLGYGTFDGEYVPDAGYLHDMGISNPRITLDDGSKVFGYQCWWGPAESSKRIIGDRKVIHATIKDC